MIKYFFFFNYILMNYFLLGKEKINVMFDNNNKIIMDSSIYNLNINNNIKVIDELSNETIMQYCNNREPNFKLLYFLYLIDKLNNSNIFDNSLNLHIDLAEYELFIQKNQFILKKYNKVNIDNTMNDKIIKLLNSNIDFYKELKSKDTPNLSDLKKVENNLNIIICTLIIFNDITLNKIETFFNDYSNDYMDDYFYI